MLLKVLFFFSFLLHGLFYHCLKEIGDLNPGPWSILKPPTIHTPPSGQRLVSFGSCLVFSLLALSIRTVWFRNKLGCLRSWTSLLSHFSFISKQVVWTAAMCVTIVQLFDWDAKFDCLMWSACDRNVMDFINLQSRPGHSHQLKCSAHQYRV